MIKLRQIVDSKMTTLQAEMDAQKFKTTRMSFDSETNETTTM